MNLGRYAKTIAAVIGAVVTVGGVILSQHYVSGSAEHWVTVVVAVATALASALGVYGVPNAAKVAAHPSTAVDLLAIAGALYGPASKVELNAIAKPDPTSDPNNVQTFTSGVIVPLAAAPESVGNAWDNAVASIPGLSAKLEKNAPSHLLNGQPASPEQYAVLVLAAYFKLPH